MTWSTAVIIASGPSLTVEQCELVRQWRTDGGGQAMVINRSFRRAPWADVLYACDDVYLRYEIAEIRRTFRGEVWTQDTVAAKRYGLHWVECVRASGLSRAASRVHHGGYTRGGVRGCGNGGFQAINLAYHFGATKIVLVGYDMKVAEDGRTHWHEPHVLNVQSPYAHWARCFYDLAEDLINEGVTCVNATPGSAIECFQRVDLAEALGAVPVPTA